MPRNFFIAMNLSWAPRSTHRLGLQHNMIITSLCLAVWLLQMQLTVVAQTSASSSRSFSATRYSSTSRTGVSVSSAAHGTLSRNRMSSSKPASSTLPPLPEGFMNPLDTGGSMLGVCTKDGSQTYAKSAISRPSKRRRAAECHYF